MKVKVTYNPEITSQPTDLDSTLNIELDYEQSAGGNIEPVPGVDQTIGGQEVEIVSSGDGLYEDSYESGRLIYRGQNPNNYIEFNDELWRIIAKEADGTYKIIRNELLPEEMPFDEQGLRISGYCSNMMYYGCNAWSATANMVGGPAEYINGPYRGLVEDDSSLNKYLNTIYLGTIQTNADKIVSHDFNIGGIVGDNNSNGKIDLILKEELNYKWNGKIALASVSDYLNANSNQSMCNSVVLQSKNYKTCVSTNWMYKSDKSWWLMSSYAYSDYASYGFYVYSGGYLASFIAADSHGVRPSLYLSSDINLSGTGSELDPYIIVS